jgi:hypothetical protein
VVRWFWEFGGLMVVEFCGDSMVVGVSGGLVVVGVGVGLMVVGVCGGLMVVGVCGGLIFRWYFLNLRFYLSNKKLYFIGINFRGYKLSRFSEFFGVRESLYPQNRTFRVTCESLYTRNCTFMRHCGISIKKLLKIASK